MFADDEKKAIMNAIDGRLIDIRKYEVAQKKLTTATKLEKIDLLNANDKLKG